MDIALGLPHVNCALCVCMCACVYDIYRNIIENILKTEYSFTHNNKI